MTRFSLFLTLILLSSGVTFASNENVVIENFDDVYRIVATSDGSAIKEIKNAQEITFRARRTAGKAYAAASYDDFTTIDKASGAKAEYGMVEDDDIFFSDNKLCVMEFPLKKQGATAKAKFERTFRNPALFDRLPLVKNYDVEKLTVRIIIPSALSRLDVKGINLPDSAARSVENTGKETVITYTLTDLKSPDEIKKSLPLTITMPSLYLTGQFPDVNALYRKVLSYTRLQSDPDSMKVVEIAREITRDCTSDSAKIAAILDYVHDNIRYIAVEHGIYGHMPDLPSEVLRKRFGDCKGSAALLRAMLRGAGLDGRYVWIGTTDIPTSWTDFHVMASGNHMIAATMTGDSLLYLDGTATHRGIGQYPVSIRGRETLVEDTETSCIIGRVGTLPPSADFNGIDVSYTIAEGGNVTADYHETLTGSFNSWFCNKYDNVAEAKRDQEFTDYLTDYRNGTRAELTGLRRSKHGSEITARLTVPNIARTIGSDIFVDLNPFPGLSGAAIDTKKRPAVDAWLGATSSRRLSASVDVPEGYTVTTLPDAAEIANEWFTARVTPSASSDGRRVTLTLDYDIVNPRIPAADIERYNADIRRAARALSSQLQLSKSE